ncbi:hypothetical protein QBC33DRAFT_537684 [Phialemonium atrogriseum]|uniref:Ubiquitin-like domain-containing protein n=1 Tax=Phialemonium atrogriseum TaxID=1093897 RepID=A0AAJ0C2H2_9PEZI|nr:uncharacterized protein QBC33DRAFT_537684 [Phialemonium atrogriseum]KAK1767898.1 hypothetical protein QBC33DRAFT_537684 [Phialemonium atrogriseum]
MVARLGLPLLQVLEYSTFGSFEDDQALSIEFIDSFDLGEDDYTGWALAVWRLQRSDLCTCRKSFRSILEGIQKLRNPLKTFKPGQPSPSMDFGFCEDCIMTFNIIFRKLKAAPGCIRCQTAYRFLAFRLGSDLIWLWYLSTNRHVGEEDLSALEPSDCNWMDIRICSARLQGFRLRWVGDNMRHFPVGGRDDPALARAKAVSVEDRADRELTCWVDLTDWDESSTSVSGEGGFSWTDLQNGIRYLGVRRDKFLVQCGAVPARFEATLRLPDQLKMLEEFLELGPGGLVLSSLSAPALEDPEVQQILESTCRLRSRAQWWRYINAKGMEFDMFESADRSWWPLRADVLEKSTGDSWIEQYGFTLRCYLILRSDCEGAMERHWSEDEARVLGRTWSAMERLHGPDSEECRRAAFYSCKMRGLPVDQIIERLRPHVEASIARPSESWSHERCIIEYVRALMSDGHSDAAQQCLREVRRAYDASGLHLVTVDMTLLHMTNLETASEGDSPQDKPIQVFVKGFSGRSYTLQTRAIATVSSLYPQIMDREGTTGAHIRLLFGGKGLEKDRLLSDYNIQEGSTLDLVYRLHGGVQPPWLLRADLWALRVCQRQRR